MSVTMHAEDDVGYVVIDTKPASAPDTSVAQGLRDAVHWAEKAQVTRVILTHVGDGLREFDQVSSGPQWGDALNTIDESHVPWIATITGAAFGAELAMACRMRIMAPDAQIALLDVTLGVIPGAGGTQRLSRLVGLERALEIICFGKPLGAEAALAIGLVHAVEDDPVAEAFMVNTEELGCIVPTWELPAPDPDAGVINGARQAAAQRCPQQVAPVRAVDVLESGLLVPFHDALALERAALLELQAGGQAKALRHIFGAERAAGQKAALVSQVRPDVSDRILHRYYEAADTVFMDGSTPWEVDEAMVAFGFTLGPYEAQDIAGLDIVHANRRCQTATHDRDRRYIPIVDRMIELGKLGRKTGAGWYRYPGGGGKVEDPIVADLALEEAHFAGRTRTDYDEAEITRRLLLAMINEAAHILHEGIVPTAADIDLVTVATLDFPRWRGGLMFYADCLGVPAIVRDLGELAQEDPVAWQASPVLLACADAGISLFDYTQPEDA